MATTFKRRNRVKGQLNFVLNYELPSLSESLAHQHAQIHHRR